MYMIRKNIYITEEQHDTLVKHPKITVSEHIRRAIDEYIERMRPIVSRSPTDNYGKITRN